MKLKSILRVGLALIVLATLEVSAQQAAGDPQAAADAANRAEALRNPHPSPRQRFELERAAQAQENLETGVAALANNARQAGVTTLPSGVEYRVMKAGSGKRPSDASTVLLRYKGTLSNGSVFDRSDDKAPAALKVAGLLPGLHDAVTRMQVGAQWEVVVPPSLGYGARGKEGVGPNAVLTYLVELLGIR